jgi:cell division GTPase FtsZ
MSEPSGAKGVLFNVVGNDNLSLFEVNEAAEIIKQAVDPDANIIFGVVRDNLMDKDIKITLIATGFEISPLTGNCLLASQREIIFTMSTSPSINLA